MADSNSTPQALILEKRCPKCGQVKVREFFGPDKKRSGGLRTWCKDCHNKCNRKWRAENPEVQKAAIDDWRKRNPDRVEAARIRFHKANPGRMHELVAKWRTRNPDRSREINNKATRKARDSASGKLRYRVSNAVRSSLIKGKGGKRTFEILGYTLNDLAEHIERQFTSGMCWEEFRSGRIHIDHIRPLSSFKIESVDSPSFRQAWALANLRPMWAQENLRKSAKVLFLI